MTLTFALNALLSLGLMSGLYSSEIASEMDKMVQVIALPQSVEEPVQTKKEEPALFPLLPVATHEVWLTAYSSAPEETDDTPFITATGSHVRDGIVATNFLPFGTRMRIPDVFGDKIFVVDDRMHPRKTDYVDVWMPTKQDALNIGRRRTVIVVLAPETNTPIALAPNANIE